MFVLAPPNAHLAPITIYTSPKITSPSLSSIKPVHRASLSYIYLKKKVQKDFFSGKEKTRNKKLQSQPYSSDDGEGEKNFVSRQARVSERKQARTFPKSR